MSAVDRKRACRRLAEAFLKEAARIRYRPPTHCERFVDEARESYLSRSIEQLTHALAEEREQDGANPLHQ